MMPTTQEIAVTGYVQSEGLATLLANYSVAYASTQEGAKQAKSPVAEGSESAP